MREFVDACNEEGIIPFFYHTLLDWWHVDFNADFPKYLEYLRDSVEILCKNYGKIGGIWFDGMWSKPEDDWEEDALYGLIRKYQPEPTDIVVEGKQDDFVLKYGKNYYLFCYNLPMIADANVAIFENTAYDSVFKLADKIQSVRWMDNGEEVAFKQDGEDVTITTVPFTYGRNLVVRVAKIVCE